MCELGTCQELWEGSVLGSSHQPLSLLGKRRRADDHGLSALRAVPSRSKASISALATAKRSEARLCGRHATGGPGVVRM